MSARKRTAAAAKTAKRTLRPEDRPTRPVRNVAPDAIDFRDRKFLPAVDRAPPSELRPGKAELHPVLNQTTTDACTGFALATVIHVLLGRRDGRLAEQVSPFMLYGMARHYDNLSGTKATNGSSVRGALKGWFKHGACARPLWPRLAEPKPSRNPDWWDDGALRPLGAYFRVEPRSIVDMQYALNEAGVLYASADTHPGWDVGWKLAPAERRARALWTIPTGRPLSGGGGHAFAILGYTADGFVIQNSWGEAWASGGLAVLSYNDWLVNAWDCWVAQLGVVTHLHREAAKGARSIRHGAAATNAGVLDVHAISPYVVNTGNDGELSQSGQFHTTEQDLDELVDVLIPDQRREWGIPAGRPLDVALYAHGGLVDERAGAHIAAKWIDLLKSAQIFPVFFLWESGILDTLANEIRDWLRENAELPVGGPLRALDGFWSDRVESVARRIGRSRWEEMKENARLLTEHPQGKGGARLLLDRLAPLRDRVNLHLVGHSAGAIVHAALAHRAVQDGWTIRSLTLLAPAARVDLFDAALAPHLRTGRIERAAQFHLSDSVEDSEGELRVALLYKRSLLYLIANGLEERRGVPVLGMQKYFDAAVAPQGLPNLVARAAPSPATGSSTHGGFDDDRDTQLSVLRHIQGQPIPS